MNTSNESILNDIEKVARRLEESYPGSATVLENFPSGVVMLDVRWREQLLVLAYLPEHGFGVEEVNDDNSFSMDFGFIAPNLQLAEDEIHRRLKAIEAHLGG